MILLRKALEVLLGLPVGTVLGILGSRNEFGIRQFCVYILLRAFFNCCFLAPDSFDRDPWPR